MRSLLPYCFLTYCLKLGSILLAIGSYNVRGQVQPDTLNIYRPKIAEFAVEFLSEYKTNSSSEAFGNAASELEKDQLIKTKLGIPLMIRDDRVFGVQFKYYQHAFNFDSENNQNNYDLYSHLDSKKLTNTGLRVFWQQDIKKHNKLMLIGGAELSSDKINWNRNSSRYFVSGVYSWQVPNSSKMGFGFVVNSGMQITTVYPLFIYEKQLSSKWVLDMSLPKSVAIRWKRNNGNYLIAKTEVKGWRYNLTNAIEGENQNMTLRRADLLSSISWEKEIHDWLWFGLTVGHIKNLRYYLVNIGDRRGNALIDIKSQSTGYLKFSLFIVPPRRFYR